MHTLLICAWMYVCSSQFTVLMGRVHSSMADMEPRNLASTLWSMAKLRDCYQAPPALVDELLGHVARRAAVCDVYSVGGTLVLLWRPFT